RDVRARLVSPSRMPYSLLLRLANSDPLDCSSAGCLTTSIATLRLLLSISKYPPCLTRRGIAALPSSLQSLDNSSSLGNSQSNGRTSVQRARDSRRAGVGGNARHGQRMGAHTA